MDQEIHALEYDIGPSAHEPYMQADYIDTEYQSENSSQSDCGNDDQSQESLQAYRTREARVLKDLNSREARVKELLDFLTTHSKKKKLTKEAQETLNKALIGDNAVNNKDKDELKRILQDPNLFEGIKSQSKIKKY